MTLNSWRIVLVGVPVVMLSIGVPLVDRIQPRILGLPFTLAWIVFWVIATSASLYTLFRLEGRDA